MMGTDSGFISGVVTLGQSLIEAGSKLERIVMITPDVTPETRKSLLSRWNKVIEVDYINCKFKTNPDADDMFDMKGEKWKTATTKWAPTCTKLAAWTLTSYDRIIFMDSDMIAVGNVDDALYKYSNQSFLAAPETLPPDTLNSGFMVLNPSLKTFKKLLELNDDMGVAWTGMFISASVKCSCHDI